jgi:hypothetical protein
MLFTDSEVENPFDRMLKKYLPDVDQDQATKLVDSAVAGGEIHKSCSFEVWLQQRASFGTVMLDSMDYVTALTHALRIAPNLAATDYGTSRQRDLGQLWTDVARGFLGEIGLAKFMRERFGLELILDYSLGPIEDYLPSDIKAIKMPNGNVAEPNIKISFKTTKFNGIWLDIPGAQVRHSDAFVLIKLGISREHFIAFLKWISFIRDKLLPRAVESGAINQTQAKDLWDSLPEFKKIPCYICGFLDDRLIKSPPDAVYRAQHTRAGTLKGYLMKSYVGWVKDRKPELIPEELKGADWRFESIGTFSAEDHFVANTGSLMFSDKEWKDLVTKLIR